MIRFRVSEDRISFRASEDHIAMKVESAVQVGASGQIFDGSYDVIPTVDGMTMDTKNKYMRDDVNVHPIPFFSVGNNSGGNTVYIGSEVVINGSF